MKNPSGRTLIQTLTLAVLLALGSLFASVAKAADVDVLIIGESTLNAGEIRTQLSSILGGAGVGTVNVVYEPTSASSGRNLATWYHETAYDNQTVHLARLQNLRSESGTQWDYIVLLENRATIQNYPGQYAVGVSDIYKEVQRAAHKAEIVLMVQWPTTVSTNRVNTINYYKEVTYRVGRSLGVKVAPAGMAWDAAGRPTNTTQQAYIAAASIYSRIWNKNAATDSTYNYNDTLAQTAFTTVTNNVGQPQYSGKFEAPIGIYGMRSVLNRNIGMSKGRESSTENNFVAEHGFMVNDVSVSRDGAQVYKLVRSTFDNIDDGTKYSTVFDWITHKTDSEIYQVSNSVHWDLSSKVSSYASAWNSGAIYRRHMPDYLLFTQFRRENSTNILAWHAGHADRRGQRMRNAYMYTLATGRCPIPQSNSYGNAYWDAVRIGYETAWRLSTLQGRAPGFRVTASNLNRYTTDAAGPEKVPVSFVFPPRSNVTVTVTTDQPWASGSPQVLTFTPENYSTIQYASLIVTPATPPGSTFNVTFTTSSTDEVYNGLVEKWDYRVNRRPIANNQSIVAYSGWPRDIKFTGSEPDAGEPAYGYRITRQPNHGTVAIFGIGEYATYTPDAGYVGADSFEFVRYDWHTNSISAPATVTIDVQTPTLYDRDLIKNGNGEMVPHTANYWTIQSSSWFNDSLSGTNPKSGNHVFRPSPGRDKTGVLYQDVDVSDYAENIALGIQPFTLVGHYINNGDTVRILVECLSASNSVLRTESISCARLDGPWGSVSRNFFPPAGTTKLRVKLSIRQDYVGIRSQFDLISLVAKPLTNIPPVANPQEGIIATSGVDNPITLTASDADGDPLTYIIVNQPANGTVTVNGDGPTVNYVPTLGYLGSDSFSFKVNDGLIDSAVATVTTTVVDNQAPTVTFNSPASDFISIPLNVGILIKTDYFDDKKPAPAEVTWTQISGPSEATFSHPNETDTAVSMGNGGIYVLRLHITDGEFSVTKDLTVQLGNYNPEGNLAPIISSPGLLTGVVGKPITVEGAVVNDGDGLPLPTSLSILWEFVSGPGYVSFSDASIANPIITCDTPGSYIVRLTANDGEVIDFVDVPIQIAGNSPPTVNAGPNQTIAFSGSNPILWTPVNLTNSPAAWYDAADASTITQSSGAVSQWRDKSAAARNLNQSTSSARPKTGTRTINGLNAIEFDGSNDVLLGAANRTAAITIFGVVHVDSGSGTDGNRSWLSAPGGGNPDFWMPAPANSDTLGAQMCDTAAAYSFGGGAATRNQAHIIGAYSWVAGGAAGGVRVDGSAGTSLAAKTKSLQQLATELAIGRQKNVAGRFHDGLIGEVIILNRRLTESDEEFLKIEGYLAHKWGTATNLYAAHPYKSAAPTQVEVITASTTLVGSASDADNDPLTTTWSVISQPEGADVTFADASALNTTATFTALGSYVLRLTADDGVDSRYDDVTITVTDGSSGLDAFNEWAANGGITFNGDSNSDGVADGMGWLLGADVPTNDANGLLPQTAESGGDLTLSFKMLNSTQRGSAVIYLQYSSDLGITDSWSNNSIQVPDASGTVNGVEFIVTPINGTDHNQVQAIIPASVAGEGGKIFARLQGMLEP